MLLFWVGFLREGGTGTVEMTHSWWPYNVALLLFNNLIKSHSKYTKRITANKSGS